MQGLMIQNGLKNLVNTFNMEKLENMNDFTKDGYLWIYAKSTGPGDVFYNTLSRIIDMEDKSDWAHHALRYIAYHLMQWERWPDWMNDDKDAKTRIGYYLGRWLNKILRKFGISRTFPERPQHDMTRDPYIAFYCAAVWLEEEHYIEKVKPPWYNWRRETWMERKKLLKNNKPEWIQRLDYYRDKASVMKKAKTLKWVKLNREEAGLI